MQYTHLGEKERRGDAVFYQKLDDVGADK